MNILHVAPVAAIEPARDLMRRNVVATGALILLPPLLMTLGLGVMTRPGTRRVRPLLVTPMLPVSTTVGSLLMGPLLVAAMLPVSTTVGSRRMGPLLVTAMLSVGALAMPRALDIGVVVAPLLGGGVFGMASSVGARGLLAMTAAIGAIMMPAVVLHGGAAIAVALAVRRVNRTDKAD